MGKTKQKIQAAGHGFSTVGLLLTFIGGTILWNYAEGETGLIFGATFVGIGALFLLIGNKIN